MREDQTGQITLDPVLTQLRELTGEVRDQGKLLSGVVISVENLSKKSDKIERAVEHVAEIEWACPARRDYENNQKRISKIEALNQLRQTGETSIVAQIPGTADSQVHSAMLRIIAQNWAKILPWIIASLLGLLSAAQQGWLPGAAAPAPSTQKVDK